MRDKYFFTLLHIAVQNSSHNLIEHLVSLDPRLQYTKDCDGLTPLGRAIAASLFKSKFLKYLMNAPSADDLKAIKYLTNSTNVTPTSRKLAPNWNGTHFLNLSAVETAMLFDIGQSTIQLLEA